MKKRSKLNDRTLLNVERAFDALEREGRGVWRRAPPEMERALERARRSAIQKVKKVSS